MNNPFRWLFYEKNRAQKSFYIKPESQRSSQSESPTLSNRSSPGKKVKLERFLGANARPPLF